MTIEDATKAIVTTVDRERGTMPQDDDFTFVLIEWGR
jgi:hypothetical protein